MERKLKFSRSLWDPRVSKMMLESLPECDIVDIPVIQPCGLPEHGELFLFMHIPF